MEVEEGMEERLRPGLTARVEVTVYEGRDVVLVPRVAIRREGERSMVRVGGRGGVEWRAFGGVPDIGIRPGF